MNMDAGSTLNQALPLLLGTLGPLVTAMVEKLVKMGGQRIPLWLKPIINTVAGAFLAALSVGNTPEALLYGGVGAQVGNRVREGVNKEAKKTPAEKEAEKGNGSGN